MEMAFAILQHLHRYVLITYIRGIAYHDIGHRHLFFQEISNHYVPRVTEPHLPNTPTARIHLIGIYIIGADIAGKGVGSIEMETGGRQHKAPGYLYKEFPIATRRLNDAQPTQIRVWGISDPVKHETHYFRGREDISMPPTGSPYAIKAVIQTHAIHQ